VAQVDTKGVEIVVKSFKGKLVDTLELVCHSLDIDLIMIEPRTNSLREEVYLGKTSGNQKFYELRGYKKLGSIYFPKQSEHPFYCYEFVL